MKQKQIKVTNAPNIFVNIYLFSRNSKFIDPFRLSNFIKILKITPGRAIKQLSDATFEIENSVIKFHNDKYIGN